MSPDIYGSQAAWLWADSPPDTATSWHELHRLAERADVSIEALCEAVEAATDFSKATSTPFDTDDLEAVISVLADDDFDLDDFILESKAVWNEADHPRDKIGRFTDSSEGAASREIIRHPIHRLATPTEKAQMHNELTEVHDLVQQLYPAPHLKSRWKRETQVSPIASLRAAGMKKWSCQISLALELLQTPAARLCTMIHEPLHAISPTTKEQYEAAIGWQEAVIEGTARHYRDHIMKQVSWAKGPDFTPHQFLVRDRNHPYTPLVNALEAMRNGLKIKNVKGFYDHLMQTPATELEGEILKMAQNLSLRDKNKFDGIFDAQAKVLRDFGSQDRMFEQQDELKGQTSAMKRQGVIVAIMSARTTGEVIEARRVRDEWLDLHPNDWGIYEASEMLEMLAEAKGLRNPHMDAYNAYVEQQNAMNPPESSSEKDEVKPDASQQN